jgi:spore maturation protein SpmB
MPNNIYGSAMVCTDNYVFSISGYNTNITSVSYRAPISADGSIGTWTQITAAPVATSFVQTAIAGNKIYFIGGYSGNSDYLYTVYSATFTSGITDYTQYYTDQLNTSVITSSILSSTFKLPDLPSTSYSAYYIKT